MDKGIEIKWVLKGKMLMGIKPNIEIDMSFFPLCPWAFPLSKDGLLGIRQLYTHTNAHSHAHTHSHTHTHTHTHIHTNAHTQTQLHTHTAHRSYLRQLQSVGGCIGT